MPEKGGGNPPPATPDPGSRVLHARETGSNSRRSLVTLAARWVKKSGLRPKDNNCPE